MDATLCTGFRLRGPLGYFLFLNDSTGPDGAQEYAVLHLNEVRPTGILATPIESLTVSWMSYEMLLGCIHAILSRVQDTTCRNAPCSDP